MDETRFDDGALSDSETRACLASVLRQLAAAIRTFGHLVRTDTVSDQATEAARRQLEATLTEQLAEAQRCQGKLADLLRDGRAVRDQQPAWPLHGELLTHLTRLRAELEVERRARAREHWQHRDASTSPLLRTRLNPWLSPKGRPLSPARKPTKASRSVFVNTGAAGISAADRVVVVISHLPSRA